MLWTKWLPGEPDGTIEFRLSDTENNYVRGRGMFKTTLQPRNSQCYDCKTMDFWKADVDYLRPLNVICVKENIKGIYNSIYYRL